MIERFSAPPPTHLLDALATIQASAYAPTGLRGWSARQIAATMSGPTARLLVAYGVTDIPVGFLLATVLDGEAEILVLAVNPSCQRRGIASRLDESLEMAYNELKIKRLILEVAEINHKAIAVYEILNFQSVGIRRNYYCIDGKRVDARIMKKRCLEG